QYEKVGRLSGILRDYLDRRANLQQTGSGRLARALLLRSRGAQRRGETPDFDEVAARFEENRDTVGSVVEKLTGSNGLLRVTSDGQFEFEPPQIVAMIGDDASARQPELDRLARI